VAIVLALLGLAMAIYLVALREPRPAHNQNVQERATSGNAENGIVTIPGRRPVDQTVQRLEGILQAKGVKLFALIDHSGEAENAGMHMRLTRLLIFGSPQAGTPLMIDAPSVAIDLPLKIVVSEGADGQVRISYNAPGHLQQRHGLPPELVHNPRSWMRWRRKPPNEPAAMIPAISAWWPAGGCPRRTPAAVAGRPDLL
jgi:uncharacterized protein (DUF302 family)